MEQGQGNGSERHGLQQHKNVAKNEGWLMQRIYFYKYGGFVLAYATSMGYFHGLANSKNTSNYE